MISMPVHFFVQNTYLGTGVWEETLSRNPRDFPMSLAFFCPRCGEVWGRAVLEGKPFMIYSILCEKHELNYPFDIPGSMWFPWQTLHNKALSREALKREVALHLAVYDRFKEMYHDE
jgi:hypothetical protein